MDVPPLWRAGRCAAVRKRLDRIGKSDARYVCWHPRLLAMRHSDTAALCIIKGWVRQWVWGPPCHGPLVEEDGAWVCIGHRRRQAPLDLLVLRHSIQIRTRTMQVEN